MLYRRPSFAPAAVANLANQAFADYRRSYGSVKCKIYGGQTYCKSKHRHGNFGTSNTGNGATSQESSTPNSPTSSQESSNTGNGRTNTFVQNPPTSSQNSSNTGNAAQESSNTGQSSITVTPETSNHATTLTPIHVTTTHNNITATNQQYLI
ncbi:MAG: hypothetical protein WA364_09075 [Candidatus Nitrosopolaris sp.]